MDLDVQFVANEQRTIGDCLVAALDEFAEAFFAVAYGTHGAFDLLENRSAMSSFLKSGHRLRVLLDADRHFTDPELIKELSTFPGDVEAAVHVRGSANDPFFEAVRSYLDQVWNSPYQIGVLENPGFMEAYEAAYIAARRREAELPIPPEAPIYQTTEDITRLRRAFEAATEPLREGTVAYLLGLVAGHWLDEDLRQRRLSVGLRRGLLNRNTDRQGQIFFAGISERGFDQPECVRRDAQRIITRLETAFERLNTGDRVNLERRSDLSYRIHLQFARHSTVWAALRNEFHAAGSVRRYFWPRLLNFDQQHVRRSFLQGYMDLRTRIAATDAFPPPRRFMRVAISIGGDAPADFPENLRGLLATELDCQPQEINLLGGASRGRESLIRIDARLVPPNFLESHWQRIVVEDFREFNERIAASHS